MTMCRAAGPWAVGRFMTVLRGLAAAIQKKQKRPGAGAGPRRWGAQGKGQERDGWTWRTPSTKRPKRDEWEHTRGSPPPPPLLWGCVA